VTWVLKSVSQTSVRELVEGQPVKLQALGDLTLHGVTKEIPVTTTVTWQNHALHVTGTLDVNLTDFDIRPPSFLFFKMDNLIHITMDVVGTATP
jgi:polyisoprenoid-binding protein YceI